MREKSKDTYEAKQQWLERIMASKLNHAEKVFAFCVFKRMYGKKLVSHPDTRLILTDGGFVSSGHFQEYRDRLVRSGALAADLDFHTKNATTKNYQYTLLLEWDGTVAPKDEAVALAGASRSTSGESGSTTGASNTTKNTTKKTASKTSTDATANADAPTVTFDSIELGKNRHLDQLKDAPPSSNPESDDPLHFVDLMGVTKSPAVAPEVRQPDMDETVKGEICLAMLLDKNPVSPSDRRLAVERYRDHAYEPALPPGVKRAGWVLTNLHRELVGAGQGPGRD